MPTRTDRLVTAQSGARPIRDQCFIRSLAQCRPPQLEPTMSTARPLCRPCLAMILLLAPVTPAVAQTLAPGTRVRVKSPTVVAPVTGILQAMHRDTVVVIEDSQAAQIWTFTPATMDQLEVSVGMKKGNRGPTVKWTLIGMGTGFAVGWLVAAIIEESGDTDYNEAASAGVGAAAGAAAGAVYGYRKLEEHWAAVSLPHRVGVIPTRRGVRLSYSISF